MCLTYMKNMRLLLMYSKCIGQISLSKTYNIRQDLKIQILPVWGGRPCLLFDFGWGSAPDPAEGAYSSPPYPLDGFKGSTSKGREGKEREGRGHPRFLPGLTPLVQSLL